MSTGKAVDIISAGKFVRTHWLFLALLMSGIVIRVIASLGYRPALWFWADSFSYLSSALDLRPLESRPSGYSLFLAPFHSVVALITVQHLLGLGIAVCLYAVLRKRTFLPAWAAALATAPVLLDAYQLQLEHLVMADLLFTFLVVAAVTLLLLNPRSWVMVIAAFLLLAFSATTRTLGLPLIGVAAVWLLVARAGWRRVVAGAGAAGVAVAGYAFWYNAAYGSFGLGSSSVWLWSRTMTFADCGRMNPPEDLKVLCPDIGPRLAAPAYIWDPQSPIMKTGKQRDEMASEFSMLALRSQPLDFLMTGLGDAMWAFRWERVVYPSPGTQSAYVFPEYVKPLTDKLASAGRSAPQLMVEYQGSRADTQVAEPFASWTRAYQQHVYLRGPLLAAIFVGTFLVMIIRFRAATLLPLGFALTLLLLPPLVAAFDHRYVVPVVPLACLAAACAVGWRSPAANVQRDQDRKERVPARRAAHA
ncbi:hypothetical protein GT755_20635 [Herbidospora sp. NEAU-GS84]|uniref:Phospholipid carrier-dependent glycosyltransferase n=1 Tax=Herbidospora solisilvae TaxID=2696284 RepID=A0A7C9J411_9ACTN|nr:hypothetical protein [Herbidospora solisilvae]NAS24087.1 hypothetical protein [Herbidospora solisilvae]